MKSPTDSGRRSIWVQVAAALLPVVWWGLLTVTLGQPLHQSFIILLLPVLLASWWGGLYAGLVASGLAVVGAWDLGTDSPFLDFTTRGEPINLFSAFALFMVGLLVTLSQEAIRRRGVQLVVAERARFEEREAEATLAEQFIFQRTLLTGAGAAIIATTTEGTITLFNPAAAELLGYRAEEMIGKLTPGVFHDPAEVVARAAELSAELGRPIEPGFEAFVAKARGGEPETREWTYVRKDGSRVPVLLTVSVLSHDAGQITGFLGVARDITQRKQAETALRLFKSTLDETHDCVFMFDPDTLRFFYVNQGACEQVGYRPDELLGMHPYDLKPEYPEAEFRRRVAPLRDGTVQSLRFETVHRHRDGHDIPVEAYLQYIAPEGEPARFVNIVTDITTRRAAEAALRRSEEEFRTVVESSPNGIVLADGQGIITLVNAKLERETGYTRTELLGQSVEKLVPARYAGAHPGHRRHYNAHSENRAMGAGRNLAVRRKDGSEFPAEIGLVPITTPTGKMTLATVVDITERQAAEVALRQSEAKFRDLWESNRDAQMLCFPPEWKLTGGNAAAVVLFGARDSAHLATMTPAELSPERQPDGELSTAKAQQMIGQAMDMGSVFFEHMHRRLDGMDIYCEVALTRITLDGKTGVQATVRDITERKATESAAERERELTKAREAADAANQAKSAFLATMSHEIRTPINALVGLTYLLKGTALDENQREDVHGIEAASKQLLSLINDVLDFSKIEAGELNLDPHVFSLPELVEDLRFLFQTLAQQKGLGLHLIIEDEIPAFWIGDSNRLRQCLINYLSNAIKFTERGEIGLSIVSPGKTGTSQTLRFTVSDSGIGLSSEQQQKLFRPFVQADDTTTRRFGGTGLGLSIVKRMVELMGGQVGVSSTVGQGAQFWLEVSLQIAPAQGQTYGHGRYSTERATINSDSQWLTGLQLLIVDDSLINLEVISRVLEREGVGTTCCQSGEEALGKLTTPGTCFDAILMDLQMPGLDGCETTLEIRQRLRLGIPIIALTAGATTTEQDRAMAAGMDDFLTKPVDPERLFRALGQHIQGERQHPQPSSQTLNIQADVESRDIALAHIVSLFGKDRDFFSVLFEEIANEMREAEPQLRCWLDADAPDRGQIAQFAHKQKGQFATIGAKTVSDAALNLEQAAKTGSNKAVQQAINGFEDAYGAFFALASQWSQEQG